MAAGDERLQFGSGADGAFEGESFHAAARGPRLRSRILRLPVELSAALADEDARGTPFLFVPVLMGVGALAYFTAPREPGFAVLLTGFGVASIAALVNRERVIAFRAALVVLTLVAGALAGKVETWRASTPMNGSPVTTRVTGVVQRIEHRANGRVRLTLDLLATERPELRYPPATMRLTAADVPAALLPGETVVGLARLMPPFGAVRPGGYDFAFESYFDGIGASGFFMGDPVRGTSAEVPGFAERVAQRIERLRLWVAARVRARIGGAEGEVAAALMAGVRAGIPEETAEDLRQTGLAHILSISGLHMALVAGTVMGALRLGFAFFPVWASRHPVKKYAAGAALAAAGIYLAISGAEVAAQRSFIMLAVMLAALLVDRAAITMRNLAIAALIILIVSPHELVGPSFQMSFAATAVLIAGYGWWQERRERRQSRYPPAERPLAIRALQFAAVFLAGLAATSILAGLATSIYGVYHFNRVSPNSLWVNILAMPIVSAAVMPLAVISGLLMPLGLDGFALDLMGRAIGWVLAIAHWFAERSPIDAVGLMPQGAMLLLSLALAVLTLCVTRLRLLALVFALPAVVMLFDRRLPEILISEDARLVGVRAQGALAVNRDRPNDFTLQNWLHALAVREWQRPIDLSDDPAETVAGEVGQFLCSEELCVAVLASTGQTVVHAAHADAAAPHCETAAVIVIDDATARNPCHGETPIVATKRDLARKGAASVTFRRSGNDETGWTAKIDFAVSEPFRPWHDHRRYSREARGLAPYRRGGENGGED